MSSPNVTSSKPTSDPISGPNSRSDSRPWLWIKWTMRVFIFILHIGLLAWIWKALDTLGASSVELVTLHFFGLSLSGAALIVFSAWWGRVEARKEGLI